MTGASKLRKSQTNGDTSVQLRVLDDGTDFSAAASEIRKTLQLVERINEAVRAQSRWSGTGASGSMRMTQPTSAHVTTSAATKSSCCGPDSRKLQKMRDDLQRLKTLEPLLIHQSDILANAGRTEIGNPETFVIHFGPVTEDDAPPDGFSIRKLFTRGRREATVPDTDIWKTGDLVATELVNALTATAPPPLYPTWGETLSSYAWKPVHLTCAVISSVCTALSTVKNTTQSFGARMLPTVDIWGSHQPGNTGTVYSQLLERAWHGTIPAEWGWTDDITVDLGKLQAAQTWLRQTYATESASS
jgi:hypothetical protein